MIKRIVSNFLLILFAAALIPHSAEAQSNKIQGATPFEFWVDHLPYNTLSHLCLLNDRVYAATPYGLLEYTPASNETHRYSKINGLSGSNITALKADTSSGTLWIGYASGLVDVLTPQGFKGISDIVESPSYTGLKTINDISFHNGNAYLATNFGIVEFDITTRLAGRTFLLGPNFSSCKIQSIAISPSGKMLAWSPNHPDKDLLYGNLNQSNPKWTRPEPAWTVTGAIDHLLWYEPINGFLFAYNDQPNGESTLHRVLDAPSLPSAASKAAYRDPYGDQNPTMMYQNILDLSAAGNTLVVVRNFNVLLRSSTDLMTHTDSINISAAPFAAGVFNPLCAVKTPTSDRVYIGNDKTGLSITAGPTPISRIVPMSPYSTNAYKLKSFGEGINTPWSNNSGPDANEFGGVLVMPGALNDIWTKSFLNEGFSCYENQEWAYTSNKKLFGVTDLVDAAYQLSSDGSASLFLSSWGKGIVQLGGIGSPSDLDTIALYTTSNTDGALKGVNGNASDLRTGGLTLDNEGTLWGVQSLVSTPLFSRTADGQWNAYSLSPGADGVALKDIVATNGMLFIQSRTQGIYAFEPSSNSKKRLTTGIGSGNLPSDAVLSLAVDQDDELWIGTDHGLVVLYSPENLFKGGTSDARPILFEEDGVVQKLLGENPVTCLLVDGANQKWIGTRGAGLFLVSPDGLQTRAQFTSSNSPLLSNNILSLAIDPTSGELLIGTDAGIIGYRSNATLGNQSYYPELSLYPNPVRPGYTGPIFAKGCPEGAVVKVTDISGGLVFETRSFGGQARWEGTNHAGEPVKSGVYLFYVSNDLGEITAMGKVLIVR